MMNFKHGNRNIAISIWFKLAGYAAAAAAGMFLYYYFAVTFNTKKMSQLSEVVEALKVKSMQYHGFSEANQKTRQEKEKAEGLLAGYANVMSSVEKSQNSFLDQINEVAVQSKVKLDKTAPVESNGNKYWDISFTADYGRICEFFTQLEKYFKIENFNISGAQPDNKPEKVSARLSALASKISLNAAGNDDGKREIFDLFSEVDELLKNIETKDAENASVRLANSYDPMSLSDTIFFVEKKKEEVKKAVVVRPPVTIEGIFWDPATPVVVIAGHALKEGEEYNGVKIEKIYENKVTVSWKGRNFDLKK